MGENRCISGGYGTVGRRDISAGQGVGLQRSGALEEGRWTWRRGG